MISPKYFLEDSKASTPEILEGMKIGIPEGLGNYAEREFWKELIKLKSTNSRKQTKRT